MRPLIIFTSMLLMSTLITSCSPAKKAVTGHQNVQLSVPGPKVIIYQTKQDYSQQVPVILSEDKKRIESYPDIKDVFSAGSLAYPTPLHKGFLLDNRGISRNVAFLNITYEAFSKLPATPSPEQLMKMITDKDPLLKMYSCGIRPSYKNIEEELNAKIDANDYSAFTKIK